MGTFGQCQNSLPVTPGEQMPKVRDGGDSFPNYGFLVSRIDVEVQRGPARIAELAAATKALC